MWQRQPARKPKPKRGTKTWPEPDNYDKNPANWTIREKFRGGDLGTREDRLGVGAESRLYDDALRSHRSTIPASASDRVGAAFLIMTINQSISSGAEG